MKNDEKVLVKMERMRLDCSHTERYKICYPCCAWPVSGKHPVLTAVKCWITCFTGQLRCQRINLRYLRFLFSAMPLKCAKSGNDFCCLVLWQARSTLERWCQILSCADDISDGNSNGAVVVTKGLSNWSWAEYTSEAHEQTDFCSSELEPGAFFSSEQLKYILLAHCWCLDICWEAEKCLLLPTWN